MRTALKSRLAFAFVLMVPEYLPLIVTTSDESTRRSHSTA